MIRRVTLVGRAECAGEAGRNGVAIIVLQHAQGGRWRRVVARLPGPFAAIGRLGRATTGREE